MYNNYKELIRFDWAIKRLLRNKADYCVVEGLLTVLLEKPIKIKSLLESESNQDSYDEKYNRVDILAEDDRGELMIFEIQNNREMSYFHRMAYGTSKVISEYMEKGRGYGNLRKVYSINIVYFSLGQGDDYAYRGTTQFVSIHNPDDVLKLSKRQREIYKCDTPADIFPEYYILRVENFDKVATTPLDEWIRFLKDNVIPEDATAPGLREARERLLYYKMPERERRLYDWDVDRVMWQRGIIETERIEGRLEGFEKGYEEGKEQGVEQGVKQGIKEGMEKGLQQGMEKGLQQGMEKGLQQGMEKGLQQGMEKGLQQGMEQGLQQGMEQGLQQGMEQGLRQGMEQGLQQGMEQGLQQGMEQERRNLVKTMLGNGMTPETVAKVTGINEEELKKLL